MSAWITSQGHNQYVAEILQKYDERYKQFSLDELSALLGFFNRLSIASRYPQTRPVEAANAEERSVTIPELIVIDPSWLDEESIHEQASALHCYNYQTCETDIYNISILSRSINNLAEKLDTLKDKTKKRRWGYKTGELAHTYTEGDM